VHYAYRGPQPSAAESEGCEAAAEPPRDVLGNKRAPPLGAAADALLTDAKLLENVLEWLVTDHKEADTDNSGGSDLFRKPQVRLRLMGSEFPLIASRCL
jgi:hypothetical protein